MQWAFAPGTRLDGTSREPLPLTYPVRRRIYDLGQRRRPLPRTVMLGGGLTRIFAGHRTRGNFRRRSPSDDGWRGSHAPDILTVSFVCQWHGNVTVAGARSGLRQGYASRCDCNARRRKALGRRVLKFFRREEIAVDMNISRSRLTVYSAIRDVCALRSSPKCGSCAKVSAGSLSAIPRWRPSCCALTWPRQHLVPTCGRISSCSMPRCRTVRPRSRGCTMSRRIFGSSPSRCGRPKRTSSSGRRRV